MSKTKITIVVLSVFVNFLSCFSQTDNKRDLNGYVKSIFVKKDTVKNDTIKKINPKKFYFSLLPITESNAQGNLVVSFISMFYLSKDYKSTNISQISFAPTFNISNQFVFPICVNLYSKNNTYHLIGDYRYMIYPQPTFGIGENYSTQQQSILDYKQLRFYQFISRKVVGFLNLGLGVQVDSYQDITENSAIENSTDFYNYMKGDYSNKTSNGFTLQALYDSRQNIYTPKQGCYIEADYRLNQVFFKGDMNWTSFYFDARKYHSFSTFKNKVLATRLFYWTIVSGKPHYLDLPSIGWDRYGTTGRGFTRNRFRSSALLFFETEYRTDITKDGFLGAVFFVNTTAISKLNTQNFLNWSPAIGSGLRVKWDKKQDNNIIVDFGLSKKDWSFSLGISERF